MVKGNTDSEVIFALIMQSVAKGMNLEIAINETFDIIKKVSNKALLNIIIADIEETEQVYATKYAINENPPSLYYLNDTNYTLIASEAFDGSSKWKKITDSKMIKVIKNKVSFKEIL